MGPGEFLNINFFTALFTLLNTIALFLVLKKFLFKPVQKVVAAREEQVTKIYDDAEKDREAASSMKKEYEARLAAAREEADGLVRNAVQTAQRKGDAIVAEASSQASHLKQKAEEEIVREKKQMLLDVKNEISDLAVSIASKVVEREVRAEDHQNFVDEFIRNVGEES